MGASLVWCWESCLSIKCFLHFDTGCSEQKQTFTFDVSWGFFFERNIFVFDLLQHSVSCPAQDCQKLVCVIFVLCVTRSIEHGHPKNLSVNFLEQFHVHKTRNCRQILSNLSLT